MTSIRCQRTICGAKNFFKAPIYLKQQNYFSATVKDQYKTFVCRVNEEGGVAQKNTCNRAELGL